MSRMEPFVTDQDRTPVYGSGTSTIKPEFVYSSHTVSHTLFVDESFWSLNTLQNIVSSNSAIGMETNTLVSRPFTAEDDGDVFWKVVLLRQRDLLESDCARFVYKAEVHLESRPTGLPVFVYAVDNKDLHSAGTPPLQPTWEKYRPVDTDNFTLHVAHLHLPFAGARTDVTYLKVMQPGPGKPLSQPPIKKPQLLTLQTSVVTTCLEAGKA